MAYILLKFVHLLSVIFWIGPALGAYWMLFNLWSSQHPSTIERAELACERMLRVEHIAFVMMIVTGAAMLASDGWLLLSTPWMQQKLGLFAMIVMFEMYDIWVSHIALPKILATRADVDGAQNRRASVLRLWLIRLAVPVSAMILLVIWLAVSKTPLL